MATTGILLHVYHTGAKNWDRLTWGDPGSDELGTATQYVHTLLGIADSEQVTSIIYSGPSVKDGLIEGAYTKQFLLDRMDALSDFPSLRERINTLSADEYDVFSRRIEELVVGPVIKNTLDEVMHAAEYFNRVTPVDRVFQIAASTHAPRCLQNQLIARRDGAILRHQPWYVVASDAGFSDIEPDDVVILEPSHRGDDPMTGYSPSLASVIKPYFMLDAKDKRRLIRIIQDAVAGDTIG